MNINARSTFFQAARTTAGTDTRTTWRRGAKYSTASDHSTNSSAAATQFSSAKSCKRTAAVRNIPSMAIRHQEIERARDWLGKMWTYGRSYAVLHTLSQTRPLGFGQRWEIVRRTARDARYGPLRVAVLGLMSVAATIAYEAGRITGDSSTGDRNGPRNSSRSRR